MLAFALRRAIWALPTLFGVSLVVFLLTTLLPDPAAALFVAPGDLDARLQAEELRRTRFLDLPRLFNLAPRDVRTAVEECSAHIVADDADRPFCAERLARIGGAAFPHLLPRLDDLPPAARGRIALALAPIARRMEIGEEQDLVEPDRAALFWSRFWEDRSVDFTDPAVRRSVQRITTHDNELLEEDLRLADTFVLPQVMRAIRRQDSPEALARLTRVASHVTGHSTVIGADASPGQIRAAKSDWLSWWYVHANDYVVLKGGEKVTASIGDTRYAKWVLGAVTGQLGLSTRDGIPIGDKLLARAPVTLGMALLALFGSAAIAVPLGVLAAWRRGAPIDHVAAGVVLFLHSIPTFLLATLLSALGRNILFPALVLATVSVSVMMHQQRASMIDALATDYVRSARAKGARTLRVIVVHALRNALVPTVTTAGVQLPALIGGAFVVEEVFDIRGIGWETLRAIESHDAAWIIAVTLLCAVVTTVCIVGSDVGYGLLDPRVRETQRRRRRRLT